MCNVYRVSLYRSHRIIRRSINSKNKVILCLTTEMEYVSKNEDAILSILDFQTKEDINREYIGLD